MLALLPVRLRAARWCLCIAVLLVVAGVAGCVSISGRVEAALERKLPEAIGPADDYRVEVAELRARAGRAGRVTVEGERVRPEDAPVIDRLDLQLRGVEYDRGEDRIERVEGARAAVRLLPSDLADFLETQGGVREADVTLRAPDAATIRLRPDLGGLPLPSGMAVELTGRFTAEGSVVRFEVDELRAAGADLGGTLARRLSDVINPLVDLADLSDSLPVAALQVTDLRVEHGALRLEATTDAPADSTGAPTP